MLERKNFVRVPYLYMQSFPNPSIISELSTIYKWKTSLIVRRYNKVKPPKMPTRIVFDPKSCSEKGHCIGEVK